MPTAEETAFFTRIRQALSVDVSYETEIIPFAVERNIRKLLRDYHFPWAVKKTVISNLGAGKQDYPLPAGFKKELEVRFYHADSGTYTDPLLKKEGFVLPQRDGQARFYWLWGSNLSTDIVLDADNASGLQMIIWYESNGYADNIAWMLDRFEDVLFSFVAFRLALELGKKEMAEAYGSLWADDRIAFAKYANELQFDNSHMMMREPTAPTGPRYPAN